MRLLVTTGREIPVSINRILESFREVIGAQKRRVLPELRDFVKLPGEIGA